jgi:transcriptional regulator with XRE-family HTH domain
VGVALNLRAVRAQRRDLERTVGLELRRLREDAGLTMSNVARTAHVCRIEAGTAHPTTEVLLRLAAVLGADLSIRLFPNTGPRIRDHLQLPMSEELLPGR